MRRRGTPVSREALYEEVWTDAVTVVAPRYGLSDVGLVKICKKHGIPVPPRGYWAKVKAGRPTRKVPLPALPAGARDLAGPIPLSEQEAAMHARVRDALQQTRESQSPVSVPAELVDPHPLVRATAARLKRRDGWDHPAGVRSASKEVLDLQVTRNTLDRALLLMDTLLKSLEPSGFTARVDEEKGETLLVGGGTTLTISIVEQVTRTSHTPTLAEVRARDRYCDSFRVGARGEYPNIPQFDWHPTGRLTLTVGSWPSRKWNDTERSLIDSRLSGIVAAIVGLAEAKRAREEEEERRRRSHQEALDLREAEVLLRAAVAHSQRLQALLGERLALRRHGPEFPAHVDLLSASRGFRCPRCRFPSIKSRSGTGRSPPGFTGPRVRPLASRPGWRAALAGPPVEVSTAVRRVATIRICRVPGEPVDQTPQALGPTRPVSQRIQKRLQEEFSWIVLR
ncbi:MAG: hypothetical protein E6Q92_03860 [Burkholderiaceae bacterium]|nr:MAG: hypothetical protein E6Q92_03860 [Burkholderiaceae bacterium]